MPEYAPHGNYEISLHPDHDRVIWVAASGSINIEMLRHHNNLTNEIVEGFRGRPYGMVCDFDDGMLMTPEAEDAWVKSAIDRVARGWTCVAYHFDCRADHKLLVRHQVSRVFDSIGVHWIEAVDESTALTWVLAQLAEADRN
ncbi:hypothetical protein [Nisaea sp.]|uniref:hypothetical protein n=1 Tax=Nisaea sp. TaxID=2024842 RepID=UPI003299AA62